MKLSDEQKVIEEFLDWQSGQASLGIPKAMLTIDDYVQWRAKEAAFDVLMAIQEIVIETPDEDEDFQLSAYRMIKEIIDAV